MSDRSESPAADASERGDASDAVAPGDDEAEADAPGDADHLADIEDGAGCAEIWERLSERRGREDASREASAGDE